jgi:hypothetical protein
MGESQMVIACSYYGKSHWILWRSNRLHDQLGNECALVRSAFSPCTMEMTGQLVDEQTCPRAIDYHRTHAPNDEELR